MGPVGPDDDGFGLASETARDFPGALLVPRPVKFGFPKATSPAAAAINSSTRALIDTLQISRSLSCALHSVYYGGLVERDIVFQLSAAHSFSRQLGPALGLYIASLDYVDAELHAAKFTGPVATRSDVLKLRDEVVSSRSFPKYEAQIFEDLQASEAEIGLAVDEVAMVDGKSLPDKLVLGDVFGQFAAALRKIDLAELIPASIA